jgi:cytochrome b subunit of formate dehydrogenase
MNKVHVAETCTKCHDKIGKEFGESVHAVALGKGNADSATCTDCHGEHDIKAHLDPASRVHKTHVAQQVCGDCHASLRLTQKYGIASNTFQTFADSYHGLAVRGGSVEVVNCASCHNSHAIKSQKDPASSIHKDNLAKTCGQCHPGANDRFTIGKVHVSPEAALEEGATDPILYYIATFYVGVIVLTIGGMAVHNVLDFLTKIRRKVALQKGLIEETHAGHRIYVRMTLQERLQHGLLAASFIVLVVTGFMLRYPESWWVMGIRNVSAKAFEWRSLIHRIAGVVMLATGAWNVWYMAFTVRGRQIFFDLLPKKRDLFEPFELLRFNIGLRPTRPTFGRFSYIEKVEYWAMIWGSLIMGLTGLILWFDNTSMAFLTKLGFDISRTVHFFEAILATLAIIVWHFYFVIFNPDVYPMNLTWLTGWMSEKEMMEEHPEELQRIRDGHCQVNPPDGHAPGGPESK